MVKNNKGFMLVEVVITSTIVLTTMVALYASVNKVYNNYRVRSSYYNLDAVYATKSMINSMMKSGDINTFIGTFSGNYKSLVSWDEGANKGVCQSNTSSSCDAIRSLYNINNMILVEYNKSKLSDLKSFTSNQTFDDYIDYVINYYGLTDDSVDYSYIVLTEIADGDNYYYANIRMR